jgi:L-asparagine transporter-like permease
MKSKILFLIIISLVFLSIMGFYITGNLNLTKSSDFFRGMATGITATAIVVWLIVFVLSVFRKSNTEKAHIVRIPKSQMLLSAGMIFMFTGAVLALNNRDNSIILFSCVIIFILSMIFNITYIRKIRTSLFCK